MKEIYETDYKGTKITIDQRMLFISGGLLWMSILLLMYGEKYPALVVTLLALLPFVHEAGHYLTAREHNLSVASISFETHKIEMAIPDLMTHKDVMDIAIAGELVNGFIYLASSLAIYRWGQVTGSPFIVLFLIVPVVWFFSWAREDSDFQVALRAWQYYKAQSNRNGFL
jgi:hypothetical protein